MSFFMGHVHWVSRIVNQNKELPGDSIRARFIIPTVLDV